MYLHKTPWLVKRLYSDLIWNIDTKENKIYLTFDDGPIPEVTEWVLSQLSLYKAKATFFCVGENISKHPEIFKKVIEQGHSVGNHSYNHLNGFKTDSKAYFNNIEKCSDIINTAYKPINLFRPPYGRIKKEQVNFLKQHYKIVMWDVLSGDFDKHLSKEKCLNATLKYTRKGSIVLFHDSIKTVDKLEFVLPRYLNHFKSLGFQFEGLFN